METTLVLMHESQSLSWLVLFGGRNTNKYPSWVLPFIGTSADPIANLYIPEYEFEARSRKQRFYFQYDMPRSLRVLGCRVDTVVGVCNGAVRFRVTKEDEPIVLSSVAQWRRMYIDHLCSSRASELSSLTTVQPFWKCLHWDTWLEDSDALSHTTVLEEVFSKGDSPLSLHKDLLYIYVPVWSVSSFFITTEGLIGIVYGTDWIGPGDDIYIISGCARAMCLRSRAQMIDAFIVVSPAVVHAKCGRRVVACKRLSRAELV